MATSERTISYAGLETIFEIVVAFAEKAKAPVVLHLDPQQRCGALEARRCPWIFERYDRPLKPAI